jgi:NAD(P)-dependent dehydrogenase (short-subunit alcohol dehydrogenase family)
MAGIMRLALNSLKKLESELLGAFLGAQQVLPAMLEQGRGTILLTGATAALRGGARFSCLAVGKFGLRRSPRQSLARDSGPQGIHACLHIIIDGQIDRARPGSGDR